jgi:DNA-binding transcriptional regulator YiaG
MSVTELTPRPGLARVDRSELEIRAAALIRDARGTESQERFAQWLGVDPRTIGAWERLEKRVPGWALVAIRERRAA